MQTRLLQFYRRLTTNYSQLTRISNNMCGEVQTNQRIITQITQIRPRSSKIQPRRNHRPTHLGIHIAPLPIPPPRCKFFIFTFVILKLPLKGHPLFLVRLSFREVSLLIARNFLDFDEKVTNSPTQF